MMRVLCVDDEILLLGQVEALAKRLLPGAEVVSFNKAKAAMTFAETNALDIAFLDINMRLVDGLTMAAKLQALYPRINIIFTTGYSEYALNALELNCSGYIMKPVTEEKMAKALKNLRYPVETGEKIRCTAVCFGNFSFSVDGEPLHFKYSKTREMLAYLVDRNGALCSRKEIEAVLFEDAVHTEYMSKLRKDLMTVFEQKGISDVLVIHKGFLGIDRDKIRCDYYQYLDGDAEAADSFRGEYMTQYSFGEETLARLMDTP